VKDFYFLVPNRVRRERAGRLHCGEREKLQQVVLEHVPQHSRFLVVLAPPLHPDRLRGRDLHVRDVVPVPQRLEDRVREAEDEDVLDAFLTEVVIDAIDLVLAELVEHEPVERLCRFEAAAERLFDHHAAPGPLLVRMRALGEPVRAEVFEGRLEHAGRNRQIEKSVLLLVRGARLDLLEPLLDVPVGVVLREIAAGVERPLTEPLPDVVVDFVDLVGVRHRLAHQGAIPFVGILIARHAQQGEVVRQELLLRQIVDRRDELALGEIAGPAEDHHRARVGLVTASTLSWRADQRHRNRSSHDFFTA